MRLSCGLLQLKFLRWQTSSTRSRDSNKERAYVEQGHHLNSRSCHDDGTYSMHPRPQDTELPSRQSFGQKEQTDSIAFGTQHMKQVAYTQIQYPSHILKDGGPSHHDQQLHVQPPAARCVTRVEDNLNREPFRVSYNAALGHEGSRHFGQRDMTTFFPFHGIFDGNGGSKDDAHVLDIHLGMKTSNLSSLQCDPRHRTRSQSCMVDLCQDSWENEPMLTSNEWNAAVGLRTSQQLHVQPAPLAAVCQEDSLKREFLGFSDCSVLRREGIQSFSHTENKAQLVQPRLLSLQGNYVFTLGSSQHPESIMASSGVRGSRHSDQGSMTTLIPSLRISDGDHDDESEEEDHEGSLLFEEEAQVLEILFGSMYYSSSSQLDPQDLMRSQPCLIDVCLDSWENGEPMLNSDEWNAMPSHVMAEDIENL